MMEINCYNCMPEREEILGEHGEKFEIPEDYELIMRRIVKNLINMRKR